MIPAWPEALQRALRHVAPGGRIYIVDFWDQADLPSWVTRPLRRWLVLFDVHPRPNLLSLLDHWSERKDRSCAVVPVARGYAYLASIRVTTPMPPPAFATAAEGASGL